MHHFHVETQLFFLCLFILPLFAVHGQTGWKVPDFGAAL